MGNVAPVTKQEWIKLQEEMVSSFLQCCDVDDFWPRDANQTWSEVTVFYNNETYRITYEDHSLKCRDIILMGSQVHAFLQFCKDSGLPVFFVSITNESK